MGAADAGRPGRPDEGGRAARVGVRVARSLRERLPADLREGPTGPDLADLPFRSVYLTHHEWAAELANRTVHGVLHLGWVGNDQDGYSAQMAVLVKPNGRLGRLYIAGIAPFRYLLVYPQLIRTIERGWRAQGDGAESRTPSGPGGSR